MESPPGTYWIEPGRLLGGGHPATASMADTLRRLETLIESGVTSFVDLTEPREAAPYAALFPTKRGRRGRELQYVQMPLPDHRTPATPQVMTAILDYLERAIAEGHCVYLHCRAGIGRTGTVAGCHLIRGGMEPEQALEHLQNQWHEGGRTAVWPYTPETEEQAEYVRRWGTSRAPQTGGPWWKRWGRQD